MNYSTIDVFKLKEMISKKDDFMLLDVREPEEFEICNINPSILVPLTEFEDHLQDFDFYRTYVVYCKEGFRSVKAIHKMLDVGFQSLINLDGGILNWGEHIEPLMEIY